MSVGIRKMPADICCCCWLSLAKKRRNKKNTVFLPQCLYQGSSATGMWFSGRFVIFLFPVPPLFFFSAMFVSGKFRDGYVVFRKVCNFFVFPFLSRSSASPLSCSSVFQPPFFVLFPLFLYFYIFLSMYKKNSFVVVLKTVSRLFNKRQRRFFLEYI